MALRDVAANDLLPSLPMDARAALLARRYEPMTPRQVLQEAIGHEFAGRIALVSSFGADSVALLHLVASVDPSTPVIFVDTGKMFGSTHRYRRELTERFGLTDVRLAQPDAEALARQDPESDLWMQDSDRCCAIRKVAPLAGALAGFDAWISGRKRFQGGMRSSMPLAESDGRQVKINPMANWSRETIADYVREHDLPEHPMVAEGYRSIGCMPCTDKVAEGESDRAGRWRGKAKSECGIHLGLSAVLTDIKR
ncbi:phosphoadenylylsulfate reductase (thioredoxin) [Faunimonas pinastri]|uniref:Adenosine 5'-phosphosulfate reductase n=1 Tax=Faunimonas pinastri TaxID=1855383 RepID=A0A1H9LX51_9HYPH|nr:phosphoadenylyl-sulfate reductase [Faunimonas pinastri]SER15938.1 phosphoadenylylsulfate reductase (thioredoxin) [Faunimonas pinastri]